MSIDIDEYDFFVSYARADNKDGRITHFIEALSEERRKLFGDEKPFTPFFDQSDIRTGDDWQHRIAGGLAASRLFLALISPNYFVSEWCRKEWMKWIEFEISKHILSEGVAPIYFVEVPGLTDDKNWTEQRVAEEVAKLSGVQSTKASHFLDSASEIVRQLRRRQVSAVLPFDSAGKEALFKEAISAELPRLAENLSNRVEMVDKAAASESDLPPYNKQFTGRLDELYQLRDQLNDDRTGVICSVHGLGGIGKTELALTYAHAFASFYPGGRFYVPCERAKSLKEAALHLSESNLFNEKLTDEERKSTDTHFVAVIRWLKDRLREKGRILLMLDNVTDENLLNREQTDCLTSLGPNLHLLATTRRAPHGKKCLMLSALPGKDALVFLEKYKPLTGGDEAERIAAEDIVEELGGFPLAIELIGAWLGEHPDRTYADVKKELHDNLHEALDDVASDPSTELRRHNHERRLSVVLNYTLNDLSDPERRILEYAALLPPDSVPRPWLEHLVTEDYPAIGKPLKMTDPTFNDLLKRLCDLALVTPAEGESSHPRIFRLHRLVGAHLLDQLKKQGRYAGLLEQLKLFLQKCAAEVHETATRENKRPWMLDPIEQTVQLLAEQTPDPDPILVFIALSSAQIELETGRIYPQKQLLSLALEQSKKLFKSNPNSIEAARLLFDSSELSLHHYLGRSEDLERVTEILKSALAVAKILLVEDPLFSRVTLGALYLHVATHLLDRQPATKGRILGALDHLRMAREIAEEDLGRHSAGSHTFLVEIASRLQRISSMLQKAGAIKAANGALNAALEIGEKLAREGLDVQNVDLVDALECFYGVRFLLAGCYRLRGHAGDPERALEEYQLAAEAAANLRTSSPDSTNAARKLVYCFLGIALIYRNRGQDGDMENAERYLEEVQKIREELDEKDPGWLAS